MVRLCLRQLDHHRVAEQKPQPTYHYLTWKNVLTRSEQGLQETYLLISFQLNPQAQRRWSRGRRSIANLSRRVRRGPKQHFEHLCFGFGLYNWEKILIPPTRSSINALERGQQVHGVNRQLQRMHGLRVGLPNCKTQSLKLHTGQTERYRDIGATSRRQIVRIRNCRPWPNPLLGIYQRLEARILRCVHQGRGRGRPGVRKGGADSLRLLEVRGQLLLVVRDVQRRVGDCEVRGL